MAKSRKLPRCSDLYKTEDAKNKKFEEWHKYMAIITNNYTKPLEKHAFKKWEKEYKKGFMFGCKDFRKTNNLKKTIKNGKKKFKS
jgi:hypothetical protein